jgi:thymidine kinase
MPLTLITGPMKSGKSLELIARVAPYEFARKRVIYIQPKRDTREEGISSRLGLNTKAERVASLRNIKTDADVIGIDEVHMFDAEDADIVERWLKDGKEVLASGLDLDYRSQLTPMVKRLIELGPELTISKPAVCEVCLQYTAAFTQILQKGKPVLDGLPAIVPEDGTYVYEARCRNCFAKAI